MIKTGGHPHVPTGPPTPAPNPLPSESQGGVLITIEGAASAQIYDNSSPYSLENS